MGVRRQAGALGSAMGHQRPAEVKATSHPCRTTSAYPVPSKFQGCERAPAPCYPSAASWEGDPCHSPPALPTQHRTALEALGRGDSPGPEPAGSPCPPQLPQASLLSPSTVFKTNKMLELTQFHWVFFPVLIASRCNLVGRLVSTVSIFVRASLALGLISISEVLGETHFLDFLSPTFTEFWKRW